MDVARRVTDFVQEELLFEDGRRELTNETSLLDGVIDSLGLMQIISFLEEEYGIEVDPVDVTIPHFGTAAAIERFVNQKLGEA
jgi:acyl carrier protein